MLSKDREAQNPDDAQHERLELNKETLEDLDVDASDVDQVKGGQLPTWSRDPVLCNATPRVAER